MVNRECDKRANCTTRPWDGPKSTHPFSRARIARCGRPSGSRRPPEIPPSLAAPLRAPTRRGGNLTTE